MKNPKWVCSNHDRACGTLCFICKLEIEAGQEVVYLFGDKAFRHATCVPPKSKVKIPTEDEIRRDQFRNCGYPSKSGIGDWREDASPYQEDAIRKMEGD